MRVRLLFVAASTRRDISECVNKIRYINGFFFFQINRFISIMTPFFSENVPMTLVFTSQNYASSVIYDCKVL